MKGIKTLFTGTVLTLTVFLSAWFIAREIEFAKLKKSYESMQVIDTDFGNFLAGSHALYINDFDAANEMFGHVNAENIRIVHQNKILASFFSGKMPSNVDDLKDSKELSNRLIYDAHLILKDDWKSVYSRHSKDDSMLIAPLRIFAGVKQGKTKEVLKFIDSLKTSDSWKAFMRGQIAVLENDVDKAAKEFANVEPAFMNVNDYLYLMSFYKANNMTEDMDILREDFTSNPGGMYILDYPEKFDWSMYEGLRNNLVHSIVQTVSHTQVMIFTDLSLLMLRFADVIAETEDKNAIDYYLGQYYFYNNGDYEKSFNKVAKTHPLYIFGQLKIVERANDAKNIKKIAQRNPLFLPVTSIAISNEIKNGNKRAALRIVNKALRQKNLTDNAKKYFLKKRANIYVMFNDPDKAQKDLDAVMKIDNRLLNDIMMLQARIWNQKNIKLDEAYNYAMTLVKRNTSDLLAWDILGVIVDKNEGVDAGLEILDRVSRVGASKSSLFEHLGDLSVKKGDIKKARAAYMRALELSDDGLIVVPFVQKKIRKLK